MKSSSYNNWSEVTRNWRVLLASFLGLCISSSGMYIYTKPMFFAELHLSLGWSRSELAIASIAHVAFIVVLAPFVGSFMDRRGIRGPIAFSLVAQVVCYIALAAMPAKLWAFYGLQALLSALGVAATPLGYSRAISSHFDAKRGFALSVSISGMGLIAITAPLILPPLMAVIGWRGAYLSMAGFIAVLSIPTLWLLGPDSSRKSGAQRHSHPRLRGDAQSLDKGAASESGEHEDIPLVRRPVFWLLMVAFMLPMLFGSGYMSHFILLLRDRGYSATDAGMVVSVIGAALFIGRLGTGFLLDHLFAPRVMAVILAMFGAGLLMLRSHEPALLLPAAFTVGFALGAELDVLAYLVSRYFPLKNYGRNYGVFYSTVSGASSFSALLLAQSAERTGSYDLILAISAGVMLLSSALFLCAPRFPSRQDRDAHPKTTVDSPAEPRAPS